MSSRQTDFSEQYVRLLSLTENRFSPAATSQDTQQTTNSSGLIIVLLSNFERLLTFSSEN